MTQNMHPLRQRIDQLAADLTTFAVANGATARAWSGRKTGRSIGVSLGLVRGLINHHYSLGEGGANRSANSGAISMSSAEVNPTAISTPHSTETKTEAGDSGQVAAQTNPAPPAAETSNGNQFLAKELLLTLAAVMLFLAMFVTHFISDTPAGQAASTAASIITVSAQLLIAISFYLKPRQ